MVTGSAVKRTCPQWCTALSMIPAKSHSSHSARAEGFGRTARAMAALRRRRATWVFVLPPAMKGFRRHLLPVPGGGEVCCVPKRSSYGWVRSPIRCPDKRAIMNALLSQFHNFVSVVRDTLKLNPLLWRPAVVNRTSFSPYCTLVWFSGTFGQQSRQQPVTADPESIKQKTERP